MATLYYGPSYFTTSLNVGGGIDDTQTTGIVLQSVSGLDITKPGICIISYSDPIDTDVAEWVTFTSINGSNELQGVTRGEEGYGAKTHLNSATITFPISKSHINKLNTMFDTALDLKEQSSTPATPSSNYGKIYISDGTVNPDKVPMYLSDSGYTQPFEFNNSIFRQAIINGNFDVWQRGTTFIPNDDVYTVDRWNLLTETNGAWTIARDTDVPTGVATYSAKLTNVTLNNQVALVYLMENVNAVKFDDKTVNLSFYAKTSGTEIANLRASVLSWSSTADSVTSDVIGTWAQDGTNPTWATNWTAENTPSNLALTSNWTRYSLTAVLDTASMANIAVVIWVDDGTIAANDDFWITGVQLCAGDIALPFQPKSFENELISCQRYFEKSFVYSTAPAQNVGASTGEFVFNTTSNGSNNALFTVPFAVNKRTSTPTMTFYEADGASANWDYVRSGASGTFTPAFFARTERAFIYYGAVGASWVACQIYGHWTADAEL